MSDLTDVVLKLVAEQLQPWLPDMEISLDARFREDLNADSLDEVELIMAMEEVFGIYVSYEDAEKLLTPRDAINYLTGNPTVIGFQK